MSKADRVLVHIGKCGGSTLSTNIATNNIVFDKVVHIFQPTIDLNARYLIVTRSPIARALSAFNWRYHLVVTTNKQPRRFPGEKQILKRYGTLNALAEALYVPHGEHNAMAQGHFHAIHHLAENISFYLTDLLAAVSQDQIEGVISQESLADDANALLGLTIEAQTKEHKTRTPPEMLHLSNRAKRNLVRILQDDFDAMKALESWGKLSAAGSAALAKEGSWASLADEDAPQQG